MALLAQSHFKSNYPVPTSVAKEKNAVWLEILGSDNHKAGVTLMFKRSTCKWAKKLENHAATGENGATVNGGLASIWRDCETPGQNELVLRGAKCMSWSESWFKAEVPESFGGTMQSACAWHHVSLRVAALAQPRLARSQLCTQTSVRR